MTVQEIKAKKSRLEAELTMALEAAKVLAPVTPEFDDAYGRYLNVKAALLRIPEELVAALKVEHAGAIKVWGVLFAEHVQQLIKGLRTEEGGPAIEELLGEPVVSLVWIQGATGIDKVVPAPVAYINPTTKVKGTGGKSEPKKTGGRTFIKTPAGETMSLTKFALQHASPEEIATCTYKTGVTSHVLVDSKPKFLAFCTAHGLTGYEYIMPGTSGKGN